MDVRIAEPEYTGVLYCIRLKHVSETEPLYGIPYYGQAVRVGTAENVARARWKEEVNDASKSQKTTGLLAVLCAYGEDAFEWEIVASLTGPRGWVQTLMDEGEIALIAEAGGVLRDMNRRLEQTLNLQEGGKCKTAQWWQSLEVFRQLAFTRFKSAMNAYVNEFGTSLVPYSYVDPVTRYTLGSRLAGFRVGRMRNGLPNQKEIEAWAESLPKWAWKPLESVDYWCAASERGRLQAAGEPDGYRSERHSAWHRSMSDAERNAQNLKIKDACNKPETREANSKAIKRWHANMSDSEKELRSEMAHYQAVAERDVRSKRHRQWLANEDDDAKTSRLSKRKAKFASKAEEKLSRMSPDSRRKAVLAIQANERGAAKRANELKLLRTVKPDAKQCDIPRAKREGWMPRSV